uniref:Uncharacterized protein n=1 Tax=Ixodes scapularis TaxID=6945 RepID=A0A4D5RB34_IXOSC
MWALHIVADSLLRGIYTGEISLPFAPQCAHHTATPCLCTEPCRHRHPMRTGKLLLGLRQGLHKRSLPRQRIS